MQAIKCGLIRGRHGDGGRCLAQERAPTGVCEDSAHDTRLDPVVVAGAAVGAAGDDVEEHFPDGQHRPCKQIHMIVIDTTHFSGPYGLVKSSSTSMACPPSCNFCILLHTHMLHHDQPHLERGARASANPESTGGSNKSYGCN